MCMAKKKKIIILCILPITTAISVFLVFNIISLLRYHGVRPEEIIYKNITNSDVDYKVYLKTNEFFDHPYISNDFSYATSLIEYINATIAYEYVGTSGVGINYDYYIKATIISNFLGDSIANLTKPLWTKDFILLEHKSEYSPNSKFKINENIDIGIDYYNNLLDKFRYTTNVNLDSRLDITMVVTIRGKLKDDKLLAKDHHLTISIPLGVKAFDINLSQNFKEQEILYSKEQRTIETSYMIAITYIVLFIIILGISIYMVRLIIDENKNIFEIKVKKLLKEYDDRIVTVSNFIRYEKMEIVEIPNFNELLTLSDETMEPIIYWEKKGSDTTEAWFCVIKNKVLYRYMLSFGK